MPQVHECTQHTLRAYVKFLSIPTPVYATLKQITCHFFHYLSAAISFSNAQYMLY